MVQKIAKLLQEKNILKHFNQGILIAKAADAESGLSLAEDILTVTVDRQTLLLLSGGSTPKNLYTSLAKAEIVEPGAVGLIDERFGEKMHKKSNEKMIKDSGFLRYLEMRGIPFYPMLLSHPEWNEGSGKDFYKVHSDREQLAEKYDAKLRELFSHYQKTVGVLGIGVDGHTAGIAGERRDFKNALFQPEQKTHLVSDFNDSSEMFKERVTMTFLGLSHLDLLLVLVFGEDKKEALEAVFTDGKEEEIPARFYKRPEIAPKTLFISDQNI